MKQRCLCQNLHRWVTQSIGIGEYAGIRHWWVDGLIRERRTTDTCTLDGALEKLHSAGWCASSVARGSNRQCNRSRAPGASLGLGSRRDKQGKRHLLSRANDAVFHNCHNGIWQRHIRAQTKLFFQSQTHRRVWLVPIRWLGRLLTNWRRVHWGNIGLYQAGECKTMQNNVGALSQAHEIASQRMCPFCVSRVETSWASRGTYRVLYPTCRPLAWAVEHLPCRHCHRGGYPSQVERVGTTVRTPKSWKWNLHRERSDAFRMVRASSLGLWHKPKRQFSLQIPATSLGHR